MSSYDRSASVNSWKYGVNKVTPWYSSFVSTALSAPEFQACFIEGMAISGGYGPLHLWVNRSLQTAGTITKNFFLIKLKKTILLEASTWRVHIKAAGRAFP